MALEVSLEGLSPEEINNLAALALKAGSSPETRKDFLRIAGKLDPSFKPPELEVDSRFEELDKKLNEKLAALDAKEQEAAQRARWAELRSEPVKAGLITEDELPELETYMKENGFTGIQYMQAARMRHQERMLAQPTPPALRGVADPKEAAERRKDPRGAFQRSAIAEVNRIRARNNLA